MSEHHFDIKGINIPKTKLGQTKMDKLLAAAEYLFASKGFYNTSVSDICRGAGTAVGTFYIYFDKKTDVYKYLMETYKIEIKRSLARSIKGCNSRFEREREGLKCFIKYAVSNPNIYNIIWGSLSIDKQLFIDYYVSFAKSYSRSLERDDEEMLQKDTDTIAYALMGMSNFLGLKAMFRSMTEAEIDKMIDETVMPALKNGIFK